MDAYKTFLRKKIAVYLENHLTHLLLFSFIPNTTPFDSYSLCLALFFPVSEEISRLDRDDGLWLLTQANSNFHRSLFLLEDLIHDVMQGKEIILYTALALHLATCMQPDSGYVSLKNSLSYTDVHSQFSSSLYVSGSETAIV